MPLFAAHKEILDGETAETGRSSGESTPRKRRLRSNAGTVQESTIAVPKRRKSPRHCASPNPNAPGIEGDSGGKPDKTCELPEKKFSADFTNKQNWDPMDMEQMSAVKEALHVSTALSAVVCREDEQEKIFNFCKTCIEKERAGSLYVCGCPGTGKSLSMEIVKQQLLEWTKKVGFQPPDVVFLNCTSLANASEIFSKIIGKNHPSNRMDGSTSHLQNLQKLQSQEQQPSCFKMTLIIADELDYLITKDRALLDDLFMLTTFPSSRYILIGVANAIDLADRFLPRLRSLNCKPMVITFRAYSKDQILRILQERLMGLPCAVFHPQALELCARKVAAASGDMRKALCVCRSAVEILEAEMRESTTCSTNSVSMEDGSPNNQQTSAICRSFQLQENVIVRIDHMAIALSKAYRTPIIEIIQSLPQHQQMILCSAIKILHGGKGATVGELNKSYVNLCKSTVIPPVGIVEFTNMCRVLSDQGLLKLCQARDDRSSKVSLKVDAADITFALQGVRFFRSCLQ